MQKIKHLLLSLVAVVSLSLGVATVAPQAAFAASTNTATGCVGGSILTFPCWYRGIPLDAQNVPQVTKITDIWKIVLNVIEMFMQLIGYFAAGYILWGGFKYMKSQGNPQNIASAKTTILNSAVGLALALGSVAIVRYVGGIIK
jgi:hypothetical protein